MGLHRRMNPKTEGHTEVTTPQVTHTRMHNWWCSRVRIFPDGTSHMSADQKRTEMLHNSKHNSKDVCCMIPFPRRKIFENSNSGISRIFYASDACSQQQRLQRKNCLPSTGWSRNQSTPRKPRTHSQLERKSQSARCSSHRLKSRTHDAR